MLHYSSMPLKLSKRANWKSASDALASWIPGASAGIGDAKDVICHKEEEDGGEREPPARSAATRGAPRSPTSPIRSHQHANTYFTCKVD